MAISRSHQTYQFFTLSEVKNDCTNSQLSHYIVKFGQIFLDQAAIVMHRRKLHCEWETGILQKEKLVPVWKL
jgi:hypothetical protein